MDRRWRAAVVVGCVAVSLGVLTAVRFWGKGDFWRVAVPGYLTGAGTLALAAVTFRLMQREAENRRQLELVRAEALEAEALREARKVVILAVQLLARTTGDFQRVDVIRVLNAGSEPILDVKLVKGYNLPLTPNGRRYMWVQGNGLEPRYEAAILPSGQRDFPGTWRQPAAGGGLPLPQDQVPHADQGTLTASIVWTDSRGQGWRRDGRNEPVRLKGPWNWEAETLQQLVAGVDDSSPSGVDT
jgi:hypothetical protein